MCNTVDMDVNVKKVEELTHTGDEKVELQTTRRGIPINPTSKSDTARLPRIMLLVVLRFGYEVISKTTQLFIIRIKIPKAVEGTVSGGIP